MPFIRRSLRHAACSTAGRRAVNEDRAATLAAGGRRLIAVVADGMGGVRGGDVASEAAMRGFLVSVSNANGNDEPAMLDAAFAAADRAIQDASTPERRGMGSTLVAAISRDTDIWIGNIGDSRAVLVTDDNVTPLSSDHSVIGEALRKGEISEVDALRHPDRHVLSRAIGEGDARPDVQFHSAQGVDDGQRTFLLLGSDGLFNFIGDSEILEVVHESRTADEVVGRLVRRAIENGSDDNVSAAALAICKRRRLLPFVAAAAAKIVKHLGSVTAIAAAILAHSPLARAQHVVTSDGERIVLSAGSDAGVRKGMTGKICTPETVGGHVVSNCSARFVVTSVSSDQSIGHITKGDTNVPVGAPANFDEKLTPPRREPKREPPKPDEAAKFLRDADRAFRDGDYRGALERYQTFLHKYPDHAKSDFAAERAEECRTKLAASAPAPAGATAATSDPPAPVGPPVPEVPVAVRQAEERTREAEALLGRGSYAEARSAALEALRNDSTNARARAMLLASAVKIVRSRFNAPADVAVGDAGCYVADAGNDVIRLIVADASKTVAGSPGQYGFADGPAGRAQFNDPNGVAVARNGVIYVADRYNSTIRAIAPDGTVKTIAGRSGLTGMADGTGTSARFDAPRRLAVASDDTIYVADTGNHAIRKITAEGSVETIMQSAANDRMDPVGLAVDADGNLLVADVWGDVIRKIDRAGHVSIVAGLPGVTGNADGPAGAARFNAPEGVATDGTGVIYVADTGNHTIRKIENGVVTTVAGEAGVAGASDGSGPTARLNHPSGLRCDARNRVWIADTGNHAIRLMTAGFIETAAGLAGDLGNSDGPN